MESKNSNMIFHIILVLIVIISTGVVISNGKSDNKKISWSLYAFALIFGIVGIVFYLDVIKCENSSMLKKGFIISFTIASSLLNFLGMVLAKPDTTAKDLVMPHLINILLLAFGVFSGLSICSGAEACKLNQTGS